MRTLHTGFVAVFLVCATPALAADPVLDADPFSAEALLAHPAKSLSPSLRHYLKGVVAASRLNDGIAQRELAAAYSDSHADAGVALRALSLAGYTALRAGDYATAADLFDRAISEHGDELPPGADTGSNRDAAMSLRGEPRQTSEKPVSGNVPLAVNALGLTTATVTINGHEQETVIDTGADMGAVSTTGAKQLGIRILHRKVMIGSSTTPVETQTGVADTVVFGGAVFHHVVFSVLPDAALSPLGPEHRIDAIVGYPTLAALGRVTFHEANGQRSLSFKPSAKTAQPGNMRLLGSRPFLRVTAGDQILPFAVDSGSNATNLEKRYAREFPERLEGLERGHVKSVGAGGADIRNTAIIPTLDFVIGGVHVPLQKVQIEIDGNAPDDYYGTIGADLLWAKGGYTLDFGKLELSLGGN